MTPTPDHGEPRLGASLRARLRTALLSVAPWLGAEDVGPRAVDAGLCETCGRHPRLLPTCGPSGATALCRDCALAAGDEAWCSGHREEGHAARRWATALPDRWAELVVLWWVATGEIGFDAAEAVSRDDLSAELLALLPPS